MNTENNGCGQTIEQQAVNNEVEINNGNKKTPFDLTTLPSQWIEESVFFARIVNGKYIACNDPFEVLKIEGNKLFRRYFAIDEQSETEYEILESFQISDTVVINVKPTGKEWTSDFKMIWVDKDKGWCVGGKWIFNDESDPVEFSVRWETLEFSVVECDDIRKRKK